MTTTEYSPMNGLSGEQIGVLMSPLRASRVAKRSQSGREFSYMEGYDIRAHLIRLFGFGGFSITADQVDTVAHLEGQGNSGNNHLVSVMARVTLHIPACNATYSEYAVGTAQLPQVGEAFDMATKTAVTDAMKRCAINLGTQFGLSLYDKGNTNDIIRALVKHEEIDLDSIDPVVPADEQGTLL